MKNTNEMSRIQFKDYFYFIYLNTTMGSSEAQEYARDCWNRGLNKHEALEAARK